MNAHASFDSWKQLGSTDAAISLLDIFTERAGARAFLWAEGEFDLAEAVDRLQQDAERDGLVACLGQDHVQEILARAFRAFSGYQEPPR
jgi:hypothetical protein